MLFATLATKEQLPYAFLLAESIKQHHPEARMALCLVGYHLAAGQAAVFDEVLHISRQGFPEENPTDNGPTKAYFIKHLLNQYVDDILYMDPETTVCSPLEEIFPLLRQHSVIAVPFNLEPYPKDHDNREMDRLRQGFIDTGFLALQNSDQSRQFADWWSKQVDRATLGPSKSAGADHIWLSLGVVPFRIRILREPGYRLAPWNWHEKARTLNRQDKGGVYLHNGKRLRSFVTAWAHEDLQAPAVPLDELTRSVAGELLAGIRHKLERIRQTLPE